MSLLRYAASSILRNRRHTFSAVLGILLAVTFVAGTFVAIDSSARATLNATLHGLHGDFSYSAVPPVSGSPSSGNPKNGTDLRDALAAVPGVTDASIYRQINASWGGTFLLYNPRAATNNSFSWSILTAVDPHHLPCTLRDATISGSILLPNGTVALDSQTATDLQVRVGDPVGLLSDVWSPAGYVNHSMIFTVGAIARPMPPSSYGGGLVIDPGPGSYEPLFAINLRDIDWVLSRLGLASRSLQSPQIQGEIWVDRGHLVNPYDIQGTKFQLSRLDRQLTQAMIQAGYSGQVNDDISSALSTFQSTFLAKRTQYLLISSPVILLGLYLGAVGVDLGHAERRRELGILKARGMSRRQVALLLILESLLGGIVAAVLGLFLGIALSRFLIGAVTPFGASAASGSVTLTPDTIVIVVVLSIVFMAIASYRSAKRAAALPIVETLRHYAPGETRIHYSPTADIAMIGYSIFVLVMYWYATSGPGNLFIIMIAIPFLLTLPVTPILLTIGSVRLMTRSSGRVYEWTSRLIRPFAKNLEYVVSRNLSRNPRRSSNIAIIIALGLAFGVFIVSSLGSQQEMQEQSLRGSIGADMSATPPFMANGSADAAFEANLSKVQGVAQITHVLPVSAQVSPRASYDSPYVYAIDPSSYFTVSQPAPFYFEKPRNEAATRQVLAVDGQVLITGQFAKDAALQIGDSLILSITTYPNGTPVSVSVTVHVGGIVRFLPGTYNGYSFGVGNAPEEVYGSHTTLRELIVAQEKAGLGYPGSDRFLVALQPGADWKVVKAEVLVLGSANVLVYREYQEQLAQISNSTFLEGSFLGFVRMEIAFIVVILTAGLALIIYAAGLERTVEFACITARGSSGWQTAGLLVGEACSIMLLGVVVGFAAGLLAGYLSVGLTYGSLRGAEPVIPNLLVFPVDGLLLLVLAPAAMFLTTIVVAWRIERMNVAQVLRMRGG